MPFAALLALTLTASCLAGEPMELAKDRDLRARERFFADSEGNRFLDVAPCRQSRCLAVRVLQASRSWSKRRLALDGGRNPAGALCEALGGEAEVLYTLQKAEISVCAFEDGSKVLAWDLYNAHFSAASR
jgi:putative hemolysin